MKILNSNINKFINDLSPYKNPILLYGPDEGLTLYRSKLIIKSFFNKNTAGETRVFDCKEKKLTELENVISSGSLFSKKEVLKITNPGESLSGYFDLFNSVYENNNVLIVIIAGELAPRSKIRTHFEREKNCGTIACYKTDPYALKKIIIDFAIQNNLKLENSSISYLVETLGDNFQIILNELDKLLFLNEKKITYDMVRGAVSSNNSEIFENMVFNCFENKKNLFIREFNLNVNDHVDAGYLLYKTKNLLLILNKAIKSYNENNISEAVKKNMPKYLFRKKTIFAYLVQNKNKNNIAKSLGIISEIELKMRKNQNINKIFLLRGMLNLAQTMK